MTGPLTLRCDASARVGLGHFTRCLALAQAAAARGAQPRFLVRADDGARTAVAAAGFPVEELADASDGDRLLAAAPPGSWIVLDGYELPRGLGAELRRQGRRVLRIVDGPAEGEADLFVNANLHAPSPLSPAALFGPRYALLRPEFAAARAAGRPQRPGPLALLILFGGSDVLGLTARVIAALGAQAADRLPPLVLTAVLGPAARPDAVAAARLAATACRIATRVLVAPPSMAEVMAESDLAITAAGSSVLELCALGVPALAVTVAANQDGIAAALQARGAGLDLGPGEGLNDAALVPALVRAAEVRPALAAAARELVDGDGALRVLEAMESIT